MSEDLKKKLKNKKEGTLSDEDLDNVAGGNKGNGKNKDVSFKYAVEQIFTQNENVATNTRDTLKIKSRYSSNGNPSYKAYIEIWKNGTLKRSGNVDLSEEEIDNLSSSETILNLAKKYGLAEN